VTKGINEFNRRDTLIIHISSSIYREYRDRESGG